MGLQFIEHKILDWQRITPAPGAAVVEKRSHILSFVGPELPPNALDLINTVNQAKYLDVPTERLLLDSVVIRKADVDWIVKASHPTLRVIFHWQLDYWLDERRPSGWNDFVRYQTEGRPYLQTETVFDQADLAAFFRELGYDGCLANQGSK